MTGKMATSGIWWKPSNFPSIAWLILFLPGLVCYLYFLSLHLNQYDEVPNSVIERFSSKLDDILPPGTKVIQLGTDSVYHRGSASAEPAVFKVEMVANGFGQTEGPQWINDEEAGREYLIFSDIPNNRIWKWEEGGGIFTLGKSLFLDRSGCRGDHCAGIRLPGSNGLTMAHLRKSAVSTDVQTRDEAPGSGEIVMCEHGDRRVTRMETNGTKTALATHFNGRRLNSPNDLAFSKRGDVYFTDPPCGLPLGREDPEFTSHGFGGVYRIRKETIKAARAGKSVVAEPELLEKDFTFPNGLAFSADYSKLYLAVSSHEEPAWYVYDLGEDGDLTNRRRFLDALPMRKGGRTGSPDGLKVDEKGNIFAACPGGLAVIDSDGGHLGTVFTGGVTVANVAFAGDGHLYMAASDSIMRVRILTKAPQSSPSP